MYPLFSFLLLKILSCLARRVFVYKFQGDLLFYRTGKNLLNRLPASTYVYLSRVLLIKPFGIQMNFMCSSIFWYKPFIGKNVFPCLLNHNEPIAEHAGPCLSFQNKRASYEYGWFRTGSLQSLILLRNNSISIKTYIFSWNKSNHFIEFWARASNDML